MQFTLQLGFSSYQDYPAIAMAAEEAGFSYLSMPDSLFFPRTTESDYPYADTQAIRTYLEQSSIVEPVVAMAVMAAVTSRIRFYPGVLKVPVRQPLILAKQLNSLAAMSNGRIALGAGLSPWKEDFSYNGVAYEKRGVLMDECIEIIRGLASGDFFEHHGEHYDFGPLRIRPVPPEPVPIFIGGHSKPALRRAARLGDGWVSANSDLLTLTGMIKDLHAFRSEYGTDDGRRFEIHGIDFSARTEDDFRRLAEAGVTHAGVLPWDAAASDARDVNVQIGAIHRFGDEIISRMR